MKQLRQIKEFVFSLRCLKWVGLLVAFYLWVTIMPPAIWCVIPGLTGFITSLVIEISVPAVLVMKEYRRKSRINQTCQLKCKWNPEAIDEYVEMINKSEKEA